MTVVEIAFRENYSVNTFRLSLDEASRPVGEVNALVEELLVIIELLLVAAHILRCVLMGHMVEFTQPNQVAGVFHLIYKQPPYITS